MRRRVGQEESPLIAHDRHPAIAAIVLRSPDVDAKVCSVEVCRKVLAAGAVEGRILGAGREDERDGGRAVRE